MAEPTIEDLCQRRVGNMLAQKWRLDALIGIGGMAAVYAATHRNGAPCAVKILHPEFAGMEEVKSRFLREAYIGNKVGHPNVIHVTDDDVDDKGSPFLVMELLMGESLEDRLEKAGGTMPAADVMTANLVVLSVLAAAHRQGIVHRDIKPDNVFVCNDGTIKVLDFGIARLREAGAAGRDQTRTGMLMGTPSYMAPEQALGHQDQIGPASDLFSVGAMMFKMLSGHKVHEGQTEGEVLVAAATRPARSLASVLPSAPPRLVAIVDKLLAYDIGQRYAAADDVIQDIRAFVEGSDEAGAGQGGGPGWSGGMDWDDATRGGAMNEVKQAALAKVEDLTVVHINQRDLEATKELCRLLERYLIAQRQYGSAHPECAKKLDHLFQFIQEGILYSEVGLLWNLSPYAFHIGDEQVWAPDEPWSEIPYRAFASGLQVLGLLPGIERDEFLEFIRLLTLEPRNISPENDLVTLLWEAEFEHVLSLEVDSFSEGDQAQRERFEQEKAQVIERAKGVDFKDLQGAWAKMRKTEQDAAAKQAEALSVLSGRKLKAEALARVQNLTIQEDMNPEAEKLVRSMVVDPVTRQVLGAQFATTSAQTSQRFSYAAAAAFIAARAENQPELVVRPLEWTVSHLAGVAPLSAAHLVYSLCLAIGHAAGARDDERAMARAIVTHDSLGRLVQGAGVAEGELATRFVEKLGKLCAYLDESFIPAVLKALEAVQGEFEVVEPVLELLAREGGPHVAAMGAMFPKVSENVGVALVRALVRIEGADARKALGESTRSPHALVRIEALGHVAGAGSAKLREEMQRLLDDPDDQVRLHALKAMVKNKLLLAGPFLVMRIKSPGFTKLPVAERKQALDTVSALAPERAEALAVELLEAGKLFTSDAYEETREMAASLLARIARKPAALEALQAVAGKRWKNSQRVRQAAERAASQLQQRWAQEAKDAELQRRVGASA
jgi:hypothetical protein